MTFLNPDALKPKTPFQTSLSQPSVSMARALKYVPSPTISRLFSTFPPNYKPTHFGFHGKNLTRALATGRLSLTDSRLNADWLNSLSCPFVGRDGEVAIDRVLAPTSQAGSSWVVGIDPDISGAVAVLRCDGKSVVSSQVFDTPNVQVLVGKRVRKRFDAKSIVELLHTFEAPMGTTVYIEQSIPFPKDGKQGWWSGGFGYGLWIGILVASGFSVIPITSMVWKNHFGLIGSALSKDDSRKAASTLFPSLSSLLKRKKDHGRAEALLIAAYGKGLTLQSEASST